MCDSVTSIHRLGVAAWLSGSAFVSIKEVTPPRAQLVLAWVTVCRRINYHGLWSATHANSAFYPQRDGKWVPAKVRWRSGLGSKDRYGSFHLWINVWVAGKTVWSVVNTCHTGAPEKWVIKRYTNWHFTLLYFTLQGLLSCFFPLPTSRQHLSNDDCPEHKREDSQNCSVLCCVRQLLLLLLRSYIKYIKSYTQLYSRQIRNSIHKLITWEQTQRGVPVVNI